MARAVVAVWLAGQAFMLARGLTGGHLPWRMFSDPSPIERTLRAEGLTAAEVWIEVPLERYFKHTRGATGERAYDFSKIVFEADHLAERHAFARWLAGRMAEEGTPVRKVRLIRRWRDLRDGTMGEAQIGQYRVAEDEAG